MAKQVKIGEVVSESKVVIENVTQEQVDAVRVTFIGADGEKFLLKNALIIGDDAEGDETLCAVNGGYSFEEMMASLTFLSREVILTAGSQLSDHKTPEDYSHLIDIFHAAVKDAVLSRLLGTDIADEA